MYNGNDQPIFQGFPKIARLSRDIVITEKIDGTNAAIYVSDEGTDLQAASRTRLITPANDNYGFAKWVEANKSDLLTLGPGIHYGEWWGAGIQRGYGLKEKRFSLFNTSRWLEMRPACCDVVPVLYWGPFNMTKITECLEDLATYGSQAAPFDKPEGIVIFHTASGTMFKKTLEGDEAPKSLQALPERLSNMELCPVPDNAISHTKSWRAWE